MGNYEIKDPQALLEQAGNVAQIAQNILRVQEDLNGYCQQISNAWQSDTQDKESYLSGIQTNLAKTETLVSALMSLSRNLTTYATKEIQTKNSTTI